MKRKILVSTLLLISAFIFTGCGIKIKDQDNTFELGEEIPQNIHYYIEGSDSAYEQVSVDWSNLNPKKVGVYDIPITYKTKELTLKISIVDTTPPKLTKNSPRVVQYDKVTPQTFVSVKDEDTVNLTFDNGKEEIAFEKYGANSVRVIATDASGNQTEQTVDINVIKFDTKAPDLFGVMNKRIPIGASFDILANVSAIDNIDGDLTKDITYETDLDTSKKGEYTIKYSVSDHSENVGIKTCTVEVYDEEEKFRLIDLQIKEENEKKRKEEAEKQQNDNKSSNKSQTVIVDRDRMNEVRNNLSKTLGQ